MNAEMIAALRELEREKGIAFETILAGLEEAMASAYKTWWKQQNPQGDDEFVGTRARDRPGVRRPARVAPAARGDRRRARGARAPTHHGDEGPLRGGGRGHRRVQGPHRRADGQAGHLPEAPRRRARDDLRGVRRPRGRRRDRASCSSPSAATRCWIWARWRRCCPQAEQVPSEPYRNGERLKAYITEVRKGTKGPQIVVSRSHPGLLKSLFAMEVPEIEEGIVEIKQVAREPGHRSKIAVSSTRAGRRPGRRVRGPEGRPRPHGRERAPRREDRRGAVEREPGRVRGQRAAAREGQGGPDRPRHRHGARDRARLPAVARDRQGGPERPPRRAADRLADRHQVRDAVRGGPAAPCGCRRRPWSRCRPPRSRRPRGESAPMPAAGSGGVSGGRMGPRVGPSPPLPESGGAADAPRPDEAGVRRRSPSSRRRGRRVRPPMPRWR